MNNFLDALPQYPISALKQEFIDALCNDILLLEAEPGAGKSTLAPLWALASIAAQQKIILVQPRVLAAQALAQRLADLLSSRLGEIVGYHVAFDSCISAQTRLIVTTPGILLQQLLQNPMLDNVSCVMLDEIHERSVNQDMLWAMLQEVRILRDDLSIVLMSATPDPQLQQHIPRRLFSPGICYPVTTHFLPAKTQGSYPEKIEDHVLRALASHNNWQASTTLVFLPGWNDIEKCSQAIRARYPAQNIYRLHSRVPAGEQRQALNPILGARIILATNIAETSLTISDVTLVIDSGLVRRADYEQRTGLTRLRNAFISQASADQRRGRAGRVQAGHCIRLWSQDQFLAAADLPEIRSTDYLPLALRLAHWGSPVDSLPWIEAPNKLALEFAQQQLQRMQLLDENKKITPAGIQVSALGTHPRIAAFLLAHQKSISKSSLFLALALHFECNVDDMRALLSAAELEVAKNNQWQILKKRWLRELALMPDESEILNLQALARAFSDRIGYLQASGRYRLNSGISIDCQENIHSSWAVFPVINVKPKGHTGIGVALSLTVAEQRALSQMQTSLVFKNTWQQQRIWRMGGVTIDEQLTTVAPEKIASELIEHIRILMAEKNLESLHWDANSKRLLQRARLIAEYKLADFPPLDEKTLLETMDQWLAPFLNERTGLEQLPWQTAFEFYLGYDNCQTISELLPEKIQLPSGRIITIEFSAEGVPQVAAKLQEFFGCEQVEFAGGRLPLKIHLLSPNGSPLAITANLKTFWQQAYADVRKEMRGRYPRHPWPENPLEHAATALTKRKLALQQPPSK